MSKDDEYMHEINRLEGERDYWQRMHAKADAKVEILRVCIANLQRETERRQRYEPAERIQPTGTNMKAVLDEAIRKRREAAAMARLTPSQRAAVERLEAEG